MKEKYHGKELGQNCAVEVDYTNETVQFRCVGNISIPYIMFAEGLNTTINSIMLILLWPLIGIMVLQEIGAIPDELVQYIATLIFLALPLTFLFNTIKAASPTWRKNIMPLKSEMFPESVKEGKKEWLQVNPEAIINKQLVLHEKFSNAYLKYKTSGDYSRYLSHITIRETFLDRAFQDTWKAIFVFKKKPKKGEMWILWH